MEGSTVLDPPATGEGEQEPGADVTQLRDDTGPGWEEPEGGGKAADDDATAEPTPDLKLKVGDQLTFAVGGKRVTTSSLRIVGGKVDLEGMLDKGEDAVLRLEVRVSSVAFVDKIDGKTGQVTGCERQHKARVVGIAVVDDA